MSVRYIGICITICMFLLPRAWAGSSPEQLKVLLRDNPHSASLHYKLAEAYHKKSAYDKNTYDKKLITLAMSEYKKAMDLDPAFAARSLSKTGVIQHELGFAEDARDKLERALKLNPKMPVVRLILAKIYNNEGVQALKQSDYAGGLQKLEAALHLNPKLKDAQENLSTSYYQLGLQDIQHGQFASGIAKLERAMQHKAYKKVGRKNKRDAFYNWGVSLTQTGAIDQGIEKFETALKYGKNDAMCKSLAVVYCKKAASIQGGNMAAAIEWYKKGIKICPNKKDRLIIAAKNNIKALKQRLSKK